METLNSQIFQMARIMIERISEYFRFMCDNREQRLFYVLPIDQKFPYAYQHSSIRDIATICDILDLIKEFNEQKIELDPETLTLFERVTGNTLNAYDLLYHQNEWPDRSEGNIGDVGFFLLALMKCHELFSSQLPVNWEETKNLITRRLIERQNSDGSLDIFFDRQLYGYDQDAEAFYLPEALIGLIAVLGKCTKDLNQEVENTVRQAIAYLCKDTNCNRHLSSTNSTFYFNWQAQLLFQWIKTLVAKPNEEGNLESSHLRKLIEAIKKKEIAKISFTSQVATVEVACYLEGLIHAKCALEMLNKYTVTDNSWFIGEIHRCIVFLYEIQNDGLRSFHGGFVHSHGSHETRVDVAGHVFNSLRFLTKI